MLSDRKCENLQQQLQKMHQKLNQAQGGNYKLESLLKKIQYVAYLRQ